jgi:3-deoxy-manno-octulosonate cytidylyltransferase (CMP-KDO synthetase)
MKTVGVIPARYKSSRFPGKPLVDILGKPLIQRVYERAIQSRLLGSVYVATEDHRIETFCRGRGMKVVMTSDRHPTGTDRVAEVAKSVRADVYVNIQGDEPLISPASIDAAVRGLAGYGPGTATCLMKRIADPSELINTNVPKVVFNDDGEAVFFSRLPIPYPKGAGAAAHYKQVCVYAFSKRNLLKFGALPQTRNELVEEIELLRLIDNRIPLKMVEVFKDNIAVDGPADVKRVCQALKKR